MAENEEEQGISTEEFNTFRESFEHDRLTAGVDIRQLPYNEEKLQEETVKEINNILDSLANSSPGAISAEIVGEANNIFDSLTDLISVPVEETEEDLVGSIREITRNIQEAKEAICATFTLVNELSKLYDQFLETLKNLVDDFLGLPQQILDDLLDAYRDFKDQLDQILDSVFGGINDAINDAANVIDEILQTLGAFNCDTARGAANQQILNTAAELGLSLDQVETPADLGNSAIEILEESGELSKSVLNIGKISKFGGSSLQSTKFPGKTMADLSLESANSALAGVGSLNQNLGPATISMQQLVDNLDNLVPAV